MKNLNRSKMSRGSRLHRSNPFRQALMPCQRSSQDLGDGSLGTSTCHQAWWPQEQHGKSIESILKVIFYDEHTNIHTDTDTLTQSFSYYFQNLKIPASWWRCFEAVGEAHKKSDVGGLSRGCQAVGVLNGRSGSVWYSICCVSAHQSQVFVFNVGWIDTTKSCFIKMFFKFSEILPASTTIGQKH